MSEQLTFHVRKVETSVGSKVFVGCSDETDALLVRLEPPPDAGDGWRKEAIVFQMSPEAADLLAMMIIKARAGYYAPRWTHVPNEEHPK